MDTHGFNDHIITKDIYEDIAKDVKKKGLKNCSQKEKAFNNAPKSHHFNKRWLDKKTMKEFIGLRPKICSYLTDNTDKSKKAKDINYSV